MRYFVGVHCKYFELTGQPFIVTFNNHESHLIIEGLYLAKGNGVVFVSFKAFYNTAMHIWLLEHPQLLSLYFTWVVVEKSANIKSGFCKA